MTVDSLNSTALTDFIEDNSINEFRPLAYYDKHLDCIRVQIKDCSFVEDRENSLFTLWHENHTKLSDCIGFSIKGVMHFYKSLGLSDSEPVRLAEFLDAMLKLYPEQSIYSVINLIQKEFEDDVLNMPIEELRAA